MRLDRRTTTAGVIALVIALVALAVAFAVGGASVRWGALALLAYALVTTALGVLVVRTGRAAQARTARLEKLVSENHKRASVWNYRLARALGVDDQSSGTGRGPSAGTPAQRASAVTAWDDAPEIVPGRASVVVVGLENPVDETVRSVLDDAEACGIDVEVVVLVAEGRPVPAEDERVRTLGVAPADAAAVLNLGAASASGENLVFLDAGAVVRPGALSILMAGMRAPGRTGLQPLVVDGDEKIVDAGRVVYVDGTLPAGLLTGHPPADALALSGVSLAAPGGPAMVLRSHVVRQLRGFDPRYGRDLGVVDLCLRARTETGGEIVLEPAALVSVPASDVAPDVPDPQSRRLLLDQWRDELTADGGHVVRRAGFRVAHIGSDGGEAPVPRPLLVRERSPESLRWGIKVASVAGASGDTWGDTHFADSLRAAIVAEGHSAVVHRSPGHSSAATMYDDVALVLRGKQRVHPAPGQVNVLWVISHPEDVTVAEIREFDLVFAASDDWSRRMSAASGRDVVPLLQATDALRFNTDVRPVRTERALFVGGRHPGRDRPVVDAALAAGVPIEVYGRGWDGYLPGSILRGEYIENRLLAAHYRGAPRVLADHWDQMARDGFVQNRIFDAVAAGCRVVSDPVPGLAALFHGAVQEFDSPQRLAHLCSAAADDSFPDDTKLLEIAAEVRAIHSFTARARELALAVGTVMRHQDLPVKERGSTRGN